jgi:hypothetical protein
MKTKLMGIREGCNIKMLLLLIVSMFFVYSVVRAVVTQYWDVIGWYIGVFVSIVIVDLIYKRFEKFFQSHKKWAIPALLLGIVFVLIGTVGLLISEKQYFVLGFFLGLSYISGLLCISLGHTILSAKPSVEHFL